MDRGALTGYYEGTSNLFELEHIRAWITPVLFWFLFFSALTFSMIMLSAILRKQWIEHEKLSYPIILLPFEMTKGGVFYRNKLLWIGFGIGLGLDLLNGINFLYPFVPSIPIRHDIGRMFTEKPFNAIGSTPIHLNPYAIGIGFLMPLDLSLSCWVFYLFWKAQLVLGAMSGLNQTPGFPYIDKQSLGAYFGLCFFALWITHKHLWKVFRNIIGMKTDLNSESEPIGYRGAFVGFLISIAVVFGFCLKAGMSWWGILGFFQHPFHIGFSVHANAGRTRNAYTRFLSRRSQFFPNFTLGVKKDWCTNVNRVLLPIRLHSQLPFATDAESTGRF